MKAILTWSELYSLGDPTIDSQHQHLFDLANKVLKSDDWFSMGSAVLELFQYTREHFRDEEELMAERHYEDLEIHRKQHDELITKLTSLPTPSAENEAQLRKEVHGLMMLWILKHIVDEDSKIPLQ